MAITFNHHTDIKLVEGEIPLFSDDPYKTMIIMITARIIHSVYNLKIAECLDIVIKACLVDSAYDREVILQGVIAHVVSKINTERDQRHSTLDQIDQFVLMIDEVVRMDTFLQSKFKQEPNDPPYSSSLSGIVIGQCLLYHFNHTFNLPQVDTELVISSLGIGPISLSTRDIAFIKAPVRLDPDEIVMKWFEIPKENASYFRFKLLASIADRLPRVVEVIAKYIKEKDIPASQPLSDTTFKSVFDNIVENLQERYPLGKKLAHLPLGLVKAAFYGEDYELDNEVMELIRDGILVNSITEFPKNEMEKTSIHPIFNLFISCYKGEIVNSAFTVWIKDIVNVALESGVDDKPEHIGNLLEGLVYTTLKARLGLAFKMRENVSLMKLLGLQVKTDYHHILLKDFSKVHINSFQEVLSREMKFSSRKNSYKFFQELSHLQGNCTYVIKSAKKDAFDVAILLPSSSTDSKRKIVLLDAKSSAVTEYSQFHPLSASSKFKRYKQALYATKVFADNQEFDMAYVYMSTFKTNWEYDCFLKNATIPSDMTTDGKKCVIHRNSDWSKVHPKYIPKLYVTTPEEMSDFLRLTEEIYIMVRSLLGGNN